MAEAEPGAHIGRNVRVARERKLFSRKDLAERSGVSLAGIDNLERGLSARPRRGTIEKLADALDVDVDALVEEAAHPKAEAPPSNQPPLFNGGQERRVIESLKDHLDRLETALDRGDLDKVGLTVHRYIIALVGPMVEGPMRENPQEAERFVRLGRRVLDESRRLGVEDGTETAVVFDLASYRKTG
jgi:transcriptional regulator with XRE-family HTH domain